MAKSRSVGCSKWNRQHEKAGPLRHKFRFLGTLLARPCRNRDWPLVAQNDAQ